jgi:hypothetical protein
LREEPENKDERKKREKENIKKTMGKQITADINDKKTRFF